jgi:putative ABC transport system permease protein
MFSLINIIGLSAGTLCCLYILLYVSDQYAYDKHHKNASDIYRVGAVLKKKSEGLQSKRSSVVAPIAPLIKKDFGEVLEFSRVVPMLGIEKHLLRSSNKAVFEKNAVYVDSSFFDLFTYHFVYGNSSTALKDPYSIVLLESVSEKIFGRENPVGKTLSLENINGKRDFTVKAVVNENAGRSHLKAGVFITMNSGDMGEYVLTTDSWTRNGYIDTYVKLRPGTSPATLEARFPELVERYGGKQLQSSGIGQSLFLQPITNIHTNNELEGYQFSRPVSTTFLTFLFIVAVLIQVIACINFMNLSTARASKRAKEVGVRKVIGAGKKQLIQQFMGESFLISLTSVALAIPLLIICLPYLNAVTEADIKLSFLTDPMTWLLLATIVVVTGLVAGSYPAFYLAAFNAIQVIKGNFSNQVSATGIRKSLVVFQFVLSITLIIAVTIIYSQLTFLKNKDLGFEKGQQLIFTFNTDEGMTHIPSLIADLRQIPGVTNVSNATKYLSSPTFYSNGFFLKGESDADSRIADFVISDEYFVKANGIKLISGRDFLPTDSAKVLINATMMKKLNLNPQTAPGTLIYDNQDRVEEIVGVMSDFNFSSLHKEVDNFLVWMRKPKDNVWPTIIASTNTSDYRQLLGRIETAWKKNVPEEPFSYSFLDQKVQQQYESEISLSRIINLFTGIAIAISCLGLFGLAAFSAQQRSKEIGVRKVLGASVISVARLLSTEFLKLVLIAFVIASPLAWFASNKWLEGFAYKINITWWMFGIAALMVTVIALLTVSVQAIKAGMTNPVDSLRSE